MEKRGLPARRSVMHGVEEAYHMLKEVARSTSILKMQAHKFVLIGIQTYGPDVTDLINTNVFVKSVTISFYLYDTTV